ncbi:MAG: hypothetical protein HYU36_18335 [Planctomycetes bacterium]|nr:hypothetical protein [Planctomycetota bacterium]
MRTTLVWIGTLLGILGSWRGITAETPTGHDRYVTVDLSPFFNHDAIASNDSPKDGDGIAGHLIPAEELPDEKLLVEGVPFLLPPKGNGLMNNIFGETSVRNLMAGTSHLAYTWVRFPENQYRYAYLLAAGFEDISHDNSLTLQFWPFGEIFRVVISPFDRDGTNYSGEKLAFRTKKSYVDGALADAPVALLMRRIPMGEHWLHYPTAQDSVAFVRYPEFPLLSGVHTFAITLEKSPVVLEVERPDPPIIFEPERARYRVKVTNRRVKQDNLNVRVTLEDYAGRREVKEVATRVPLGEEREIVLDASYKGRGIFYQTLEVFDFQGDMLSRGYGTFAVPPESRKKVIEGLVAAGRDPGEAYRLASGAVKKWDMRASSANVVERGAWRGLWDVSEGNLWNHAPATHAVEGKRHFTRLVEENPRELPTGLGGPGGADVDWLLRFHENGLSDYYDGVWFEPSTLPIAPEYPYGYWNCWGIHHFLDLFETIGPKIIDAHWNIQGCPETHEPGLGIVWSDQGIPQKLEGSYGARAILILASAGAQVGLSDSWERPYHQRYWYCWGVLRDKEPFSRFVAAGTITEKLDGARFSVEPDARYRGGLNLYGDLTGKHACDPSVVVNYR